MYFHRYHVHAVSVCPLCGEIITQTRNYTIETNDQPIRSMHESRIVGYTTDRGSTVEVEWMCAAGCQIRVRGENPRGRNLMQDMFDPQPVQTISLTGENLGSLTPKAQQAKQALEELEEGMKPDANRSDLDKV